MMQKLERNWLVSSKLTWGISQILPQALRNLKNLHFNGLLLNKVYNVWAKRSIEELCLMVLKIDAKLEGKLTCVFKKFSFTGWKIAISFYKVKWENSIESITYWFILKIARMFPILTSRNMLMKTFIIVNITPTCKRWFMG